MLSDVVCSCARIVITLQLIKCRGKKKKKRQEFAPVHLSVNRSEPDHARMSTAGRIAQLEQMADVLFIKTA